MSDAAKTNTMNSQPFRFCPSCGTEGGSFRAQKEYSCSRCGFRFFQNVAAACGLFLLRGDMGPGQEVFLVQRALDPGKGKWGLPGGFLDPGETMEGALFREVSEEIGLAPEHYDSPVYLGAWPNIYDFGGVRYHTVDSYFLAMLDQDAPSPRLLDGELSSWSWRTLGAITLDELAFPSLKQAFVHLQLHQSARS